MIIVNNNEPSKDSSYCDVIINIVWKVRTSIDEGPEPAALRGGRPVAQHAVDAGVQQTLRQPHQHAARAHCYPVSLEHKHSFWQTLYYFW